MTKRKPVIISAPFATAADMCEAHGGAELTERQFDVLNELAGVQDSRVPGARIAPLDLGGRDWSDHSRVLAQLCKRGFAYRTKGGCWCKAKGQQFGHRCRGSFSYTITDLGRVMLKVARSAKKRLDV